MTIIDVISKDYDGRSESHNLQRTIGAADREARILKTSGHEDVRAEFIDEKCLSKRAKALIGTGIPCHLYRREDGRFGVTGK